MDHMDHDMGSMGGGDVPSMGGHSMAGMKMYVHGGIGEDMLWFASWQPTSAGATVGVCIGLFLLAILDRWIHALWRACSAGWNRGKIFSLPVASGPLPDSKTAAISSATAPAAASKRKLEKSEKSSISEKVTERVAPDSCQCGCGGECGSSSAAAAACCGDECVPSAPEYEAMDPLDDSYLPAAARGVDPRRPERWSRPFRWSVDVPRGLLYAFMNLIHFLLMLTVMTFQLWWIISVVVGAGVGEAMFGRFGASRVA